MDAKREGVVGLLFATVMWGISFPIIKVALNEISPSLFISLRFILAALIVLVYLVLARKPVKKLLKDKILWILGITNAIGFVMEFYGLTLTTASKASLLVNVNVVFMAIFSAIMLKEKITGKAKLGILVGLIGVFLTTTGGDLSSLAQGSVIGDLIIFIGGMVWAFSNIYNKRAATELGLSPMEVTESMSITTAITLVPLLFFTPLAFTLTPFSVAAFIYVTVICTIFCFYLFYRALKTITVVNAGIVMLFEIIVAIAVSFVFLGETIAPIGIAGGVLIGLSIVLVS
jgi:drug/metabolite transporter (DMT)-like permease